MFPSEQTEKITNFFVNAVRYINMTKDGDKVHWGNKIITGCTLSDCWKECLSSSDYTNKCKSIEDFNRNSVSAKKRGISIMPMKFSVAFGVKFMHQVTLYASHHGTVMSLRIQPHCIKLSQRII